MSENRDAADAALMAFAAPAPAGGWPNPVHAPAATELTGEAVRKALDALWGRPLYPPPGLVMVRWIYPDRAARWDAEWQALLDGQEHPEPTGVPALDHAAWVSELECRLWSALEAALEGRTAVWEAPELYHAGVGSVSPFWAPWEALEDRPDPARPVFRRRCAPDWYRGADGRWKPVQGR